MLKFEKDFKWTIECYENMQWMNATMWNNFMYKNSTVLILDAHAFCSNINTNLLKPWPFPCDLGSTIDVHVATWYQNWIKIIAIIVKGILYSLVSFQTILNFSKKQTYSLILIF
jgi:hypothetical protein